jgi:hypothetical protein
MIKISSSLIRRTSNDEAHIENLDFYERQIEKYHSTKTSSVIKIKVCKVRCGQKYWRSAMKNNPWNLIRRICNQPINRLKSKSVNEYASRQDGCSQ